jgi:uncharacterized protein (DUF1330 family)
MRGAGKFGSEPYLLYGELPNLNCNNADEVILIEFQNKNHIVSGTDSANTANKTV